MTDTVGRRTEVMVVEDTSASLALLCELLTQADYSVRPAPGGAMALRSAQASPPDLILLDIRMPGIDGYEVCRRLKSDARTRDIPVIFLSALRDEADTLHGFALGAVDFIAKPYRPEEVLARVRTHAELRRLQNGLEERVRERTTQLLEAQASLCDSQSRLQELTDFLQKIREEERTRIARELHDELGQALTSLRIDLGWLRGRFENSGTAVVDRVSGAYALVERTIEALRRISEGLRPGMLDVLGLAAAVEHHVTQFEERSGIACSLAMNREEFAIDGELATGIFRLVQEALTNVLRHAAASQVSVAIDEDSGNIRVCIEDDGQGFQPGQNKKTFGLLGMQERVKMLGGNLEISSQPGQGSRIFATLPHRDIEEK